jgi:hypothetical protein
MNKNSNISIPIHLRELLQPTPSGVAKLIAAWDGLTPETQILFMSELEKVFLPLYLKRRFQKKAIESQNTYVRYLVAKNIFDSRGFHGEQEDEERELIEKINKDPESLVRNAHLENESGYIFGLDDPEAFFAMPHDAQLAVVRQLRGGGEKISSIISYGVDHQLKNGKISETDLFEILVDYVENPNFRDNYFNLELGYDGFGEYSKGKDIESLWRLVPKIPESISQVLIGNLPQSSGLTTDIPEDVLNEMTDHQLSVLFYRSDIGLRELRKKIYFEAGEDRDKIRSAAVSSHFNIEYEEFGEILLKPEKEKVKILKDLAIMANDLNLCIYSAIYDVLLESEGMFDFEDAGFARDGLKNGLSKLEGHESVRQILELRLYRLAREAVPWKQEEGYPPSDKLEFLQDLVVRNSTWLTFIAFSEAWGKIRHKKLERYLPRLTELDEDWVDDDDDFDTEKPVLSLTDLDEKLGLIPTNVDKNVRELGNNLENRLAEMVSDIEVEKNESAKELITNVGKVINHATQETVGILNKEISMLRVTLVKYFLVIIIVLVFIFIFGKN